MAPTNGLSRTRDVPFLAPPRGSVAHVVVAFVTGG
jgi:hypothetical protein